MMFSPSRIHWRAELKIRIRVSTARPSLASYLYKIILSICEKSLVLKAHFDAKASAALDGYFGDAYEHERWLKRIWLREEGFR